MTRVLLWEIWRKNRVEIAISLLAIPFFAALFRWLFPEPPSEPAAIAAVYPLGMATLLAISVFSYVEADVKKTMAGFPAHTFRLPVRTETLVAIPMLLGLIVAPGIYVVWTLLVYRPIGIDLALWWPALIIAAGMTSFQAVVWTMGGHPVLRLMAFTAVASGLFWLGIAASGMYEIGFPVRPAMAVGLPILIIATYPLTVFGVSRYRCGEWPRSARTRPGNESSRSAAEDSTGLLEFTSPGRAQLWYEWRQFGFLVPAYAGVILVVLFAAVLTGNIPAAGFWRILPMVILLPIGMGTLAGPTFAQSGLWANNTDLSQFGASRPMTDTSLANAKLQALAASILAGWLLVVTLSPVWVQLSGHRQLVLNLWGAVGQLLAPPAIAAAVTLAIFALLTLSWIPAASGMCLALTGQRRLLVLTSVISLLFTLGMIITAVWIYRHPETLATALRWVRRLEWIPLPLGLAVTVTAFVAAIRGRFLTRQTLIAVSLIAVGFPLATGLLAYQAAPTIWHHLAGAAALLTALSLAPIAAGPVAVSLNRHR